MSWLVCFPWSEGIKKRACRYLLQRYLGQFLEEKLTLDQLTVDLYNGTGRVTNVSLDVQALNEMGEQQHLPLEFVDGFISEMSVSIPWSALLSEASYVEVKGLKLTVQPRQRSEAGTSMFESMWSSMTSSMQLAQECLQQDANNAGNSQPLEGVELFAQTIDSILCRVKVRFLDTVIRLEHVPLDSKTGVALEMCIKNLEYSDEAGSDPTNVNIDGNKPTKGYVISAFTTKKFYLEGVTFNTDEFPSRARTFSRSVMTMSRSSSTPDLKNNDNNQSSSSPSSPGDGNNKSNNIFNNIFQSNPIICGKLTGRQELRLKLKQGEGILGPKVELEMTFGSFILFLSPRQVHVLIELCHGLSSPDIEDMSNVPPRTCHEKPMASCDFSRVERELIQQLNNDNKNSKTQDLRNTQGWSTASFDDSDNEEEFLPMRLPGTMSDSMSTNNISMDGSASSISSKSSITTTATSTTTGPIGTSTKTTNFNKKLNKKYRQNIDNDPTTETSQFHIRVSSIAIILLHEDVLTTDIESYGLTVTSTKQMKIISNNFFNNIGIFDGDGCTLSNACKLSHIRLLAAPLIIEGSEKTTQHISSINGTLTIANFEITECLIDASTDDNDDNIKIEYINLIKFKKLNENPCLKNKIDFFMRFKYTEKAIKHGQMTKFTHPRTDIDIKIEECISEFDITIIDRISALLNAQKICVSNNYSGIKDTWNQQTVFYQAVDTQILSDSRIDIKINGNKLLINVRFPIPDLRPLHDMNRSPWWTRTVRNDFITLTMHDIQINTIIESRSSYKSKHDIQCRQLLLTYNELDNDIPIEIGKSQVDEKQDYSSINNNSNNSNECFNWPRMSIVIYPQHFGGPLEDSSEDEPGSSLDDTLNNPRHQPSPFSSKRVIHESDTPHCETQSQTNNKNKQNTSNEQEHHREGEELVIPGNRQEMTEFIDDSTHSAKIQIDINLPCLSIQIPSKHVYEQLYNRINTDLFLWEPSAPHTKYNQTNDIYNNYDLSTTLLQESIYPKFSMCKSGIHCGDSDIDSDDNDDDDDNATSGIGNSGIYHSTGDKSFHYQMSSSTNKKKLYNNTNNINKNGQSKMSLTINIGQGILSLYTPVRDCMSNVIPGQQGELIFKIDDGTIFIINSYKGDTNLGYICTMIKTLSLNHCGLTTIPSQIPPLRSINSVTPRYCKKLIYQCDNNVLDAIGGNPDNDMLSIAIKIQSSHQTHNIKTFKIAIGIKNSSLRHRMTTSQTSWFTQLTDCLDVIDHPIAGYSPPGILTTLHLHLWNCYVDYRPIYLPLRTIITIGSFSVSSNIAAKTNTSTLRFIAEDIGLLLSDKIGNNIDIKNDYICVMDLGLFELSLRLNDKMYGGTPRIDLRASNNILNIRTCSDSGRALTQLLTYFANDGDLITNTTSTDSIAIPNSGDDESLLGDDSINTLSKSQEERVNCLMEEAMEDTINKKDIQLNIDKQNIIINDEEEKVEVFFFPDESNPLIKDKKTEKNENKHHYNDNVNVDVNVGANVDVDVDEDDDGKLRISNNKKLKCSIPQKINESDDTDEDFCILGEEAGAGIMPRHGVPEIRWLSQDYLRVIDNHFSVPFGKTDLLKAPKNYPPAILRYTLCEMTLIWHMYGGKDFDNKKTTINQQQHKKKHVTIDEQNKIDNNNATFKGKNKSSVGFSKLNPNEVRFGNFINSSNNKIKSPRDWYAIGGPGRQHDVLMELQLNKVKFQHETYPDNTPEASRQVLLISEIEIRDRLASSHINKFLYQYSSEARPRQTHANMFAMKAVHIRPDQKLNTQECCLKLSLLPLRLNIDQDSLLFLIDFFNELAGNLKNISNDNITNITNNIQSSSPASKQGTPTHHPPVMSVNDNDDNNNNNSSNTNDDSFNNSTTSMNDNDIVNQNLLILLEDELTIKENKIKIKTTCGQQDDSQPIYFRSVIFSPEVLVRLDYHGKRVDLSHGPLAGLLMGLGQLNCSELRLKRLTHRHGLLGFDKLMAFMLSEWLQDIKKNQLPSLLGGVGPMHSLVQLFQGIRDLFWMPIEQYQKDGRIVRGLQRGANSFTTSTAMAALELTSRIVHAIQTTAETAYDMVSPGPSVRRKNKGQKGRRKRYSQPLDIREGMANAYMLVKEGLGETANQLVRVASEEHEQKGVSGAVGGVLRQIPPTVVKPIILATEATSNVLGGMRSQLVPDARREAAQKWRQDPRDVN
ncbi:hypothetical protein HCN44_010688 [Aphidius gifuensis]|uniref:Autophagy-related protein 2 n=1 Tax=Aphidius gifuensis TaxID=684658 RepID=A0A834XSQ8_APHGI|nr:autophagy-related protein 2 homolog B [Aphidius gifuensis]KAF7991887.1 hypothetical protein HCN44_010688 [Aphidius gifuensis]